MSSTSQLDGIWSEFTPSARYHHSAIYDPVRDRMVVFGGGGGSGSANRNDVWAMSLAGAPTWTELTPTGTRPSGRSDHSAIYDPVRDRMVVFGGNGLNDVWALSLAGAPAWTALTPTGTRPSGRSDHSAIYDPVRDRMVVFGGNGLNDVWALSLAGAPTWAALMPTGTPPIGRSNHSAIYDPVRDRVVVFGGYGSYALNDVWALSLAGAPAWTELTPTGTPPIGRFNHSAIYDSVRDLMVVFGGVEDGGRFTLGLSALSLAGTPAWTSVGGTGGTNPNMRDDHSAIYDPVRDRMVIFGGWAYSSGPTNDLWELPLVGTLPWTALTPALPDMQMNYFTLSAIYDPVGDRMVVFGGGLYPYYPNKVWAMSLAGIPAWTALTPTGTPPTARTWNSAIYDPVRQRIIVFGGQNDWSPRNDAWALSLTGTPAWAALTPTGTPPSGRWEHSAIYDPVRDRMVVFGGYNGSSYSNDVWALSLAGVPAWTVLTPTGTSPNVRSNHSAVYDPVRDRMVMFGGDNGSSYSNDVWALSLAGTPAWAGLTPTGTPPSARYGHSAIYDPVRDRMVVFGGYNGSSYSNDVWALSLACQRSSNFPHPRSLKFPHPGFRLWPRRVGSVPL